jgi:hypothetical protein
MTVVIHNQAAGLALALVGVDPAFEDHFWRSLEGNCSWVKQNIPMIISDDLDGVTGVA